MGKVTFESLKSHGSTGSTGSKTSTASTADSEVEFTATSLSAAAKIAAGAADHRGSVEKGGRASLSKFIVKLETIIRKINLSMF